MGQSVGSFEIIRRLGSGGMADVCLCKTSNRLGFQRKVVVKKVAKNLLQNEDIHKMFLDEIKVHSLLYHPNIVQVYDFGKDETSYFMVMEYVPGQSLSTILESMAAGQQKLSSFHSLQVISDVLRALAYIHNLKDERNNPIGLVHRDISPDNVLISNCGVAKLYDFGVARSRIQNFVTTSGFLKGKFSYMSPEQLAGYPLGPSSDIFSTGASLYELVTGKRLFQHKSVAETIRTIRSGRYHQLEKLREHCSYDVAHIIEKALAPSPHDRFSSAKEFLIACQKAIHEESFGNHVLLSDILCSVQQPTNIAVAESKNAQKLHRPKKKLGRDIANTQSNRRARAWALAATLFLVAPSYVLVTIFSFFYPKRKFDKNGRA